MNGERRARALRLALAAGERVGLDTAAAYVLRSCSADLVAFPRAGALARVEAPGCADEARRQVWAARVFTERGAPTVPLAYDEAMIFGDDAVSLWVLLQERRPATPEALGVAVRRVHAATRAVTPVEAPAFDPITPVRRWLDAAAPTFAADALRLRARLDRLTPSISRAASEDPLGRVLLHGDAHLDNLLVTDRGPVLVDLEHAGVGPASWDLAVLAVWVRRYGFPEPDCRRFLDAYGATPEGPVFMDMCSLYELLATTWTMSLARTSPALAREARRRVDDLLGRASHVWTLT